VTTMSSAGTLRSSRASTTWRPRWPVAPPGPRGRRVITVARPATIHSVAGPAPEWCRTKPGSVEINHLRVGTQKENLEDARVRGRTRRLRGEAHPAAKLTDTQVLELRALRENTGTTYRALGMKFSIHATTVGQIIRGEHRRHPAREPSEATVNRNKAKALAESNRLGRIEWEREGAFISPEHRIPGEEWRETKHAGYYVSSLGRVRGRRGHLLKPPINARGYAMAAFGAGNLRPIHALVSDAWHGPMPAPGMVVAHKDGNRLNNRPETCDGRRSKETQPTGLYTAPKESGRRTTKRNSPGTKSEKSGPRSPAPLDCRSGSRGSTASAFPRSLLSGTAGHGGISADPMLANDLVASPVTVSGRILSQIFARGASPQSAKLRAAAGAEPLRELADQLLHIESERFNGSQRRSTRPSQTQLNGLPS
jgi:hypothetical protein